MDEEGGEGGPPRVSVVIPTYNRGERVVEAIRSVLAQTMEDLELIVVDDGSEDDTLQRLAAIGDPRLHVVSMDRNSGQAVACNRGIEEARGDHIAFLDSDDAWLPRKLELQLRRLGAAPGEGWGACYCGCIINMADGRAVQHLATREGDVRYPLLDYSLELGGSSTLVFERRRMGELGGWDEDLARHTDWDLVVRHCRDGMMAAVPEPLVVKQGFNVPDARLYADVKERFLAKFADDIRSLGPRRSARVLAANWMDVAFVHLGQKHTVEGARYMARALEHRPWRSPLKYAEAGASLLLSLLPLDVNVLIGRMRPGSSLQY